MLNYSWREYGNRVGVWRCLELFDQLGLPTGALINTALYDHCPEVPAALVARGDELIGHGHSNAERQGDLNEAAERALLARCRSRIEESSGQTPAGWLSPWISESLQTPDLLAETGYRYTLNWCHDDQPVRMRTRDGTSLWAVPYPQELNDIPMIVARQMDAKDFAQMVIDQFDEMLEQASHQPLVMGIALHPYLVGQPYRLRHLRRALQHIAAVRDQGGLWLRTEMAAIAQRVRGLLGADGVAVLPSTASLAPLRDADPTQVDAVRLRTMAITCIAGLAGLPQVSLPLATPDGVPLGVSLLGPAGSDLALIRLAARVHAALA